MRTILRDALLTTMLAGALSVALAARNPQEHQHPGEHPDAAHRHAEAAKLKNPVAASADSIASGKALFEKQCAGCHGDTGQGDGPLGEELNPKPANLTDAEWKHGSTDGEIFVVIRDGVKSTGMKPFSRKMTAHQIWDVVNFVRSLAAH